MTGKSHQVYILGAPHQCQPISVFECFGFFNIFCSSPSSEKDFCGILDAVQLTISSADNSGTLTLILSSHDNRKVGDL